MDEQGLIILENIKKVFMTDEVETHALSGIHLNITSGEFVWSRTTFASRNTPNAPCISSTVG
ncbi:MAG: hypothetical protein ACI9VS_003337 [Candidatus Binatia bacterium]|jgi:hypothetical protein